MRLSDKAVLLICDTLVDALDTPLSCGLLNIYGSQSLYVDVLLAQFRLSSPAFKDAEMVDGAAEAQANLIRPTSGFIAAGKGTVATHFNATNWKEEVIWSGSISDMHGVGDLKFESPVVASTKEVAIHKWVFRVNKNG